MGGERAGEVDGIQDARRDREVVGWKLQ